MKIPAAFKNLRGFTTLEGVSAWIIQCKRCRADWAYPKDKAIKPGATLSLLNHAGECTARERKVRL